MQRADLKAAEAQVKAAERALAAARAERLPSASASADYGDIGTAFRAASHLYGLGHAECADLEWRPHGGRYSAGRKPPWRNAGQNSRTLEARLKAKCETPIGTSKQPPVK